MAVSLDAFDDAPGHRIALTRRAPRRWQKVDTVACERIARRRAQRLLDANNIVAATPWLEYANKMMVRNNVARLVRGHAVTI
jgi:hypothetical protein